MPSTLFAPMLASTISLGALVLSSQVSAQDTQAALEAETADAQADANSNSSANDIVVRGLQERMSSWRRAETEHAIIYSNGSESRLRQVATELEALHHLLSVVFGNPDAEVETQKPIITLVGSDEFMRSMQLVNWRAEEGPFSGPVQDQRYYDPRMEGAVMAASRIDLNFSAQAGASISQSDLFFAGQNDFVSDDTLVDDDDFSATDFNDDSSPPDFIDDSGGEQTRPWEQALFAGYAQHYITTHLPAAYPRWYIDSIGALFSTTRVNDDDEIEYGLAPPAFRGLYNSSELPDFADILTNGQAGPDTIWSSHHAWLLAHFFFLSDRNPERQQQLAQYMGAIANGRTPQEAVVLFGDLEEFQDEIEHYGDRRTRFARIDAPDLDSIDVYIQQLGVSDAAMLDNRLAIDARLLLPEVEVGTDNAEASQRAYEAAVSQRDDWIAELREDVGELPGNASALLLLAETECRIENFVACEEAADRMLAEYPNHPSATSWKAMAQIGRALDGPEGQRSDGIMRARGLAQSANRADPDAILPLVAYFRSFTAAGEAAPEAALLGMVKVIQTVPNAPEPRLMLSDELIRQSRDAAAEAFLLPLLAGPWDSPERRDLSRR